MAVHEHLCHFQVCLKLGKWDKKEKGFNLISDFWGKQPKHFSYEFRDIRMEYLWGTIGEIRSKIRQFETTEQMVGTVRIKKRQPVESIAALGDDLRKMAYIVYAGLYFNVQEVTALNQLYKTITLEYRRK